MKSNLTKFSIVEILPKLSHKIFLTNVTIFNSIDDTPSMGLIYQNDYGPENSRGDWYILVVIHNFSKIDRTVALKNKKSQSRTNSLKNIPKSS